MNPTVSIIIPACNAEATLDRCLESILTQSLREIEVLCINNGSTDGTGEILKRWKKQDKRVRIFTFEENNGQVMALKLGISESAGEYIMFADADDRLLPGACESLVRLIREYRVDILQFGVKLNVPAGIDDRGWLNHFAPKELTSEGVGILYDCYSLRRFPYNYWNKIYRGEVCRTAAASMPELRIRISTDLYLTFFFLYHAKTFRSVTAGPFYEYYVGNGISTRAPSVKKFALKCASSAIVPAIKGFLLRENVLENNLFLLESILATQKRVVLSMLLSMPEITKETIDLAVKSWGSEILYDFILATGLLDAKCKSRGKLVPALIHQIRQQNRPPASAGEITLSVGQPAR